MTENEQEAMRFRMDPVKLEQRLRSARRLLPERELQAFGLGTFDFEEGKLTGEDGAVLQWSLRRWPHLPHSDRNQQTRTGVVSYSPSPVEHWGPILKAAVEGHNLQALERVASSMPYLQLRKVAKSIQVDLDVLEEMLGEL